MTALSRLLTEASKTERMVAVTRYARHFETSLVLTLIVMFVLETLVPFMVMPPKYHVLLPSESATALLPDGGVAELLNDFLAQPTSKTVAAITPTKIAFFIKLRCCLETGIIGTASVMSDMKAEHSRRVQ